MLYVPLVFASERDGSQPRSDAAGEKASLERLRSYFSSRASSVSLRPLSMSAGGFGTSLIADFPAKSKGGASSGIDTMVFAIPLPLSIDDMEHDFCVRVAFALAEKLHGQKAAISVRIAILADENSTLPQDLRTKTGLGLRDLAESLPDAERTVVVYINLGGEPVRPELEHGTSGGIAPRYLVESMRNAFAESGTALTLSVPYNELYHLKLIRGPEQLRILRERGIPAVVLRNSRHFAARQNTEQGISAEKTAEALLHAADQIAAVPNERDERYSLMSFASFSLLLSEGTAVASFIVTAAVFLLAFLVYSLTHRHLLVARLKVFLRRSWVVFAFWAVLFVCIAAAGYILSFILSSAGASASESPYGAAALKLLLAGAFYYAASTLFAFRAVPRRAHFYGSAAAFCLAFGVLLAAVLDFTFVPTFMWAFALAFISVSIPSPSIALIPAVLSPIQIIGAAASAAGSGDSLAAATVLSSDPLVELYFAFVALPFLFLFKRVSILAGAKTRQRSRSAELVLPHRHITRPILIVGILSAAAIFAFNSAERERERPIPIRAETEDEGRFSVRPAESTFLDRRTVALTLRSEGNPIRVDLSFKAAEHITIYEAPVPFTLSGDGKTAVFSLGERPPNPLRIEVTLPSSLKGRFESRSVFYDALADTARIYRASAPVGGEGKK